MASPVAPLPSTRIKTRQLLLLAHLDRERSVLRAADAVGMSQPAASKLLRELEDSLGVTLFERHARGVEPTPYGEVVLRRARSVLSEIHRAQEEVEAMKRGEHYRVSIGCVMSPGADLLPLALTMLEQRHPKMVVSVDIDTSRPLVAKLLEGRLDIVIGRVLDSESAVGVHFEVLSDEPHSLFTREGHPLLKRRRLRIEDLIDQTWVLPPPDSILRERITTMFLRRGLPLPSRIIETSSLPVITNLLRCSDMIVALPHKVMRPYCDAGMLRQLPIESNVRMDPFGLIIRRGHTLSDQAAEALHVLREASREIYQ